MIAIECDLFIFDSRSGRNLVCRRLGAMRMAFITSAILEVPQESESRAGHGPRTMIYHHCGEVDREHAMTPCLIGRHFLQTSYFVESLESSRR